MRGTEVKYSLVEGGSKDVFAVGRELDEGHGRVVIVCRNNDKRFKDGGFTS